MFYLLQDESHGMDAFTSIIFYLGLRPWQIQPGRSLPVLRPDCSAAAVAEVAAWPPLTTNKNVTSAVQRRVYGPRASTHLLMQAQGPYSRTALAVEDGIFRPVDFNV